MKNLILISAISFLLCSACKKAEDPEGQLTVWTSDNTAKQITVKIDGSDAGTITKSYAGAPGCGDNGTVTSNLKKGSHKVFATDGAFEWSGTVNVESGKCNLFECSK